MASWRKPRYFNPIGLAFGIVMGVLTKNIPIGVAVGLALSFAIGAFDERRRRAQLLRCGRIC